MIERKIVESAGDEALDHAALASGFRCNESDSADCQRKQSRRRNCVYRSRFRRDRHVRDMRSRDVDRTRGFATWTRTADAERQCVRRLRTRLPSRSLRRRRPGDLHRAHNSPSTEGFRLRARSPTYR
ncbi:hypothetical protein [Methylosinus sp. LW4]|uniref:hypothetical protein n=1 Tax=Methylosinus sp. LW4 TaxID=136993 RepID=UPI003529D126